MKSGTLVVLHGANVHMSYENRSPHSRHAFSLHVAEGVSVRIRIIAAVSVCDWCVFAEGHSHCPAQADGWRRLAVRGCRAFRMFDACQGLLLCTLAVQAQRLTRERTRVQVHQATRGHQITGCSGHWTCHSNRCMMRQQDSHDDGCYVVPAAVAVFV